MQCRCDEPRGGDTLTYDAENRLTQAVAGGVTTSYAYAGDGRRVKKTVTTGGATTTTYYVGNYYEVEVAPGPVTTTTRYYYSGNLRVAMRRGSEPPIYLYGDHLGSSSVATRDNSSEPKWQTYYPYGSVRTSDGLPTDYAFTGQKQDSNGLMFYQARYYDAALGRFVQPDTLIPDPYNPQSLNRYTYGLNNPVKYMDPTGHCPVCYLGYWLLHDVMAAPSQRFTTTAVQLVELVSSSDRVYTPRSPDQTGQLIDFMKANTSSPIAQSLKDNYLSPWPLNNTMAQATWIALVRPGGQWDFKPDFEAARIKTVQLGGRDFNFQAVANMFFGFEGVQMGQSSDTLQAGAGAAQWVRWLATNPQNIGPGPGLAQLDDPYDNWCIRFGVFLRERFANQLDELDDEAMRNALDDFINDQGEPPDPFTGG